MYSASWPAHTGQTLAGDGLDVILQIGCSLAAERDKIRPLAHNGGNV
jgi:hypothetical protein